MLYTGYKSNTYESPLSPFCIPFVTYVTLLPKFWITRFPAQIIIVIFKLYVAVSLKYNII